MENNTASLIKNRYVEHILTHGTEPHSVYQLAQEVGIEETEFYNYFSSLAQIEQVVWADFFQQTLEKIQQEEVYEQYSVREKILALNFTLIETLKSKRSLVAYSMRNLGRFSLDMSAWQEFKKMFTAYLSQLLADGIYSNEINNRPFLTDYYGYLLWFQMVATLRFWIVDSSNAFEHTDVFIEKSVNLAFDLLGRNIVDASVDFAKFIWTHR
jgi:AcrR family transcriptional regulator